MIAKYPYYLAGEYADYVRALAIIESNEDEAKIGDGGQARGLLQQHPAHFKDYYGRSKNFPARTNHTWIEAEIVTCASFLDMELTTFSLALVIQAHNLGVQAVLDGKRNPIYLQRFDNALNRVRAESKKQSDVS